MIIQYSVFINKFIERLEIFQLTSYYLRDPNEPKIEINARKQLLLNSRGPDTRTVNDCVCISKLQSLADFMIKRTNFIVPITRVFI